MGGKEGMEGKGRWRRWPKGMGRGGVDIAWPDLRDATDMNANVRPISCIRDVCVRSWEIG